MSGKGAWIREYRGEIGLGVAVVMVLIGMLIPWLIMLKITHSTFFLLGTSYVMSLGGLILGPTSLAYTVHYYTAKKKAKFRLRSATRKSIGLIKSNNS